MKRTDMKLSAAFHSSWTISLVFATLLLSLSQDAAAQATSSTTSTTTPLDSRVGSVCSPELVDVTGIVHVVRHMTQTGQSSLQVVQMNISGIGVGEISGDTYVFTQSSHQVIRSATPALELTMEETVHLIRAGEAVQNDDRQIRALIHVTFNENGEMTAHVDSFERVCR